MEEERQKKKQKRKGNYEFVFVWELCNNVPNFLVKLSLLSHHKTLVPQGILCVSVCVFFLTFFVMETCSVSFTGHRSFLLGFFFLHLITSFSVKSDSPGGSLPFTGLWMAVDCFTFCP